MALWAKPKGKETQSLDVSKHNSLLTIDVDTLNTHCTTFVGGKLRHHVKNWIYLTHDPYILDIIYGLKLDFNIMPTQLKPVSHPLSKIEDSIIELEIQKLIAKKVILKCHKTSGDFISGIFTRPKKDGTHRMILNLKNLNQHTNYKHFKMESIHYVMDLIKPNVYMASIDLKDAFYSVYISPPYQEFLKFKFKGNLYKFTCMPNGYGPAMRIFTKITKIPFSVLRGQGHISVVYVDDSWLAGDTFEECMCNINDTIELLISLGFTIHPQKSVLTPTKKITFLGFDINSEEMSISLTLEKKQKIYALCKKCLEIIPTIRELAKLIGHCVASFPAVTYGPLYYRELEANKISSLKLNKGNFDKTAVISEKANTEIRWWINNIISAKHYMITPDIDLTLFSDASNTGWGITDGIHPAGGRWKFSELEHINVLEIKAAYFALKTYGSKNNSHIRIMIDNTTAVSYINNKGG